MRTLVTIVIPFLGLCVLPLVIAWWTPKGGRRLGLVLALVYAALLLTISLTLPLLTDVARWASDIFDWPSLRPKSYAEEVIWGILSFRLLVAVGEGLLLVRLRGLAWPLLVGAGVSYPLLSEFLSFPYWCVDAFMQLTVAAAMTPAGIPVPTHLSHTGQLAVVVVSYLGPPSLAGLLTSGVAVHVFRRDRRGEAPAAVERAG